MGITIVEDAKRQGLVERGLKLEYFTIAYNSLEALIGLIAGFLAGSIALVGFSFDSLIEVTSGVALVWRLRADDSTGRERIERISLKVVGVCFATLAVYVGFESVRALAGREAPEESLPGIVLGVVSVIVMPLLARAKRKVAAGIGSGAMEADAKQTDFCFYLSFILIAGLGLNALFGWWWADPLSGLVMVPIIGHEGYQALRGRGCGCSEGADCH
jgi:divalent metal cation (Fe/Co/Zn/Cd) transporter